MSHLPAWLCYVLGFVLSAAAVALVASLMGAAERALAWLTEPSLVEHPIKMPRMLMRALAWFGKGLVIGCLIGVVAATAIAMASAGCDFLHWYFK